MDNLKVSKIPAEELEGEDLDRAVAKEFMEERVLPFGPDHEWSEERVDVPDYHYVLPCKRCDEVWMRCCSPDNPPSGPCRPQIRNYSSHPGSMRKILEKAKHYGIINHGTGRFEDGARKVVAHIGLEEIGASGMGEARTPEVAVCRAALRAVRGQEEDE